jgi:uncharacterized membrane protein YsdA (DUF1294 family)
MQHLIIYLLAVNALTFIIYWADKRAARHKGASRTPEYVLLLAGFLGGTLAAIIAQQTLRHKNKKRSYQFKFWALTIVQVGLICFPPMLLQQLFAKLFA